MYGERHTVENFNDHGSLLMIALRSAALLNIDESKRIKKGAYWFWGCIPKYDDAAAKAEGKSDKAWHIRVVLTPTLEWVRCPAHCAHGCLSLGTESEYRKGVKARRAEPGHSTARAPC